MKRQRNEPTVIIRSDRERMFEKRHPWVFTGAVRSVEGDPTDGDIVVVQGQSGEFLARGYWNSRSQICVHVCSWDPRQAIDKAFWQNRLDRAIAARQPYNALHDSGTPNAYRLVNAENDGIPGLIVDRYADYLVMQVLTLGIDLRKGTFATFLAERFPGHSIYERSDVDVRAKEGIPPSTGVLGGDAPPPLIEIAEDGLRTLVDLHSGHKTGLYLDQQANRALWGQWLTQEQSAKDAPLRVLNCFAYTGGFTVQAMRAGAQTISVDSSGDVLALAKQNIALNGLNVNDATFIEGDVFKVLREFRTQHEQFDAIVLDPPKFAQSQKQIDGALRGYKDINLLAFQLLRPGGLLMTFSCSGLVETDLFQKVVFGALADSGREGQILMRLSASPDHPVSLTFPEGQYLKGLLCRVW